MNGHQAKKIISLGAQAVQLGTAFVQCKTSNANAAYRQALLNQPLPKSHPVFLVDLRAALLITGILRLTIHNAQR